MNGKSRVSTRIGNWYRGTHFGRYGMRNKTRRIIYHVMAILILIGVAALGFMRNSEACLRFWEAMRDFFHSFGNLIVPSIPVTVKTLPHDMVEGFPQAISEIGAILKAFGGRFIARDNFLEYVKVVALGLRNFSYFILLFATFIALPFGFFLRLSSQNGNNKHAKQSRPLKAFLWLYSRWWLPMKRFFMEFFVFFRERKKYRITLILTALFFLNVFTVLLEFFAYYFYFLFSSDFDLVGLGAQAVKLLYDVFLAFRFLPIWVWVIVGIWIVDKIRREIGYRMLEHQEENLREFIEERGIVQLYCGSMRTGKTTLVTSVLKSLNALARKWAKDGMRDIDMKFSDFPWITLEMMIRTEFNHHRVYNLYTVRQFLESIFRADEVCQSDKSVARRYRRYLSKTYGIKFTNTFFGYDTGIFPVEYDGGLGKERIEERILDYAQLYLIYITPSLFLMNYSMRHDNDWIDYGNFPEWNDDFFRREPDSVENSIMAHILNQDMLRLGKQMDPDDPYVHAFEFGLVGMTEVGKERGNQHDMEGVERKAKEVNQKNDLFDAELKMMGHLATVYHIPFIRFIADEQRPENWGANARELSEIITIRERGRDKLLMPLFALEEVAFLFVNKIFGKIYDEFRANRGDTTLSLWIFKRILKSFYNHYNWIHHTFGGHYNSVKVEKGTQDEKAQKAKLFVANKKVYANVFDTAAWRSLLDDRVKRSKTGLNDVACYRNVSAEIEEFRLQRSYFFEGIFKMCNGFVDDADSFVDLINDMRSFLDKSLAAFGAEKAIAIMQEMTLCFTQKFDANDKIETLRWRLSKDCDAITKKYRIAAEKEAKANEKAKKSAKMEKGSENSTAKADENEEVGTAIK